jgi:hypothetical protein
VLCGVLRWMASKLPDELQDRDEWKKVSTFSRSESHLKIHECPEIPMDATSFM